MTVTDLVYGHDTRRFIVARWPGTTVQDHSDADGERYTVTVPTTAEEFYPELIAAGFGNHADRLSAWVCGAPDEAVDRWVADVKEGVSVVDESLVVAAKGNTERAACKLLRRLAAQVPAGQAIVELGAYKGRTSGWLALGAFEGHGAEVYAVDPWDLRAPEDWPDGYADHNAQGNYGSSATFDACVEHMHRIDADVMLMRGFAAEEGRLWDGPPVGLLWHDAEHSAAAVEADLTAWLPHLAPDATIVLHDVGNPRFGVEAGAAKVLDTDGWDWAGRTLTRWAKHPGRRGTLVVRRS